MLLRFYVFRGRTKESAHLGQQTYTGRTNSARPNLCTGVMWIAAYSDCISATSGMDDYEASDSSEVQVTKSLSEGREMLTAEEVHDMTGVPISTLHDWAAKRERGMPAPGPHHIRLSNRHRRWARNDVDLWIESARI
jgi:predicted DNA-binding transcriptional regulator AlpA